jgi:hypothetical protein
MAAVLAEEAGEALLQGRAENAARGLERLARWTS